MVGGRLLAVGWVAVVVWLADRHSPGVMSVAIALFTAAKKSRTHAYRRSYRLLPAQRAQPNLHKHTAGQSQPNADKLSLDPNPSERNCVQPSPPLSTLN